MKIYEDKELIKVANLKKKKRSAEIKNVQLIEMKLLKNLDINEIREVIKAEYVIICDKINFTLDNEQLNDISSNINNYQKRALDVIFIKANEKRKNYGYLAKDKKKLFEYNNNLIPLVKKEYLLNHLNNGEFKNFEIINRVFNNEVIYIEEGIITKIEIENNFHSFYNQLKDFLSKSNMENLNDCFDENLEAAIKYLLIEYIKEENESMRLNFENLLLLFEKIFSLKKDFKFNELRFLNKLIESKNFKEFNLHIWYKLYKKNVYTIKIFETYNYEDKIVYGCAWLAFMKNEEDKNILNKIQFYLYDEKSNEKIYLCKESTARSFYKFDYPHEKFIYPEDNFKLVIDKEKLKTGKFKLGFSFLGETGKFLIANFATPRKFLNELYESKKNLQLIRYNILAKEFDITIESYKKNIWNKIKLKKKLIKNDLEILNKLKVSKYNIKKMYFICYFKKIIYRKPIILIGEMPNTYEDSGSVLFEELLKDSRGYNVYFVTSKKELLNRNSRFIRFGSKKHKDLFLLADVLINVQNIDLYMSPFIRRNDNLTPRKHSKDNLLYLGFSRYLNKQKKIFLQHGVLYQSGLTNGIYVNADFDYLVVSTEFEKKIFPEGYREFIESGLPRFSNYSKDAYKNKSKKILFSPTWRKYLKDMKNGEIKLEEIKSSEYYKRIMSFLTNDELIELLEQNDYKLIYNVHHTLRELIELDLKNKKLSKAILIKDEKESLNQLIKECDICITDYSSLFFDFCWQGKPVINYIYDYEEFHIRKDNNKKLNCYFDLLDFNKRNITFKEDDLIYKINDLFNKNLNSSKKIFNNHDPLKKILLFLEKIL